MVEAQLRKALEWVWFHADYDHYDNEEVKRYIEWVLGHKPVRTPFDYKWTLPGVEDVDLRDDNSDSSNDKRHHRTADNKVVGANPDAERIAELKDQGYFRVAPSVIQDGIEAGRITELVKTLRVDTQMSDRPRTVYLMCTAADALEEMQAEYADLKTACQFETSRLLADLTSCNDRWRAYEGAEADLNAKLKAAVQRAERSETYLAECRDELEKQIERAAQAEQVTVRAEAERLQYEKSQREAWERAERAEQDEKAQREAWERAEKAEADIELLKAAAETWKIVGGKHLKRAEKAEAALSEALGELSLSGYEEGKFKERAEKAEAINRCNENLQRWLNDMRERAERAEAALAVARAASDTELG
jgi:hypothetical protein